MFSITVINYLDRSSISFIALPLQQQLEINHESFGWIASAFGIGYFLSCFFGGVIVDRFGAAKTWSFFAVLWSLVMMALGLAQGFWSFFILRVFLGAAEAIHFPALLRVISDTLSVEWRARALSIGLLGVPVASVIGAPILSFIIVSLGWRWMFFILGALGIAWAFFWRFFMVDWIAHHKILVSSEKKEADDTWRSLLASKSMWGNGIQFFIFGHIVFFSLIWLPGFFEEVYHTSILHTGIIVILPWIFAALSLMLGGWFSDWLKKKTDSLWFSRILFIGVSLFLAGLCFLMIPFTSNLGLAVSWIMLGLGFAFFANAPILSLNADLFRHKVGTAQGVIGVFFALSGIISPILTGIMVQMTGSFYGAFFFVAILSMVSLFVAFIFQPFAKK